MSVFFSRTISTIVVALVSAFLFCSSAQAAEKPPTWWQFQSVDTMKFSRDLSREFLVTKTGSDVVEAQLAAIAKTGATHVGIATPYDEEFLPILRMWVDGARRHGLKVWFRGNWSGWEGWFEYPRISRKEHKEKTQAFLAQHADLFEDGDVFTACPECENGGPGDPRHIGDAEEHRQFLIEEYELTRTAFFRMGKNVTSNYLSMNGDVAKLIMDKPTTQALGGVVTIDHYVGTAEQLRADILDIAERSGGKIVLGEYGAPIPDINGTMTEAQQARWMEETLQAIAPLPELIGISYWTGFGGSTELWNTPTQPRAGVAVLTRYFQPQALQGTLRNQLDKPIANAIVTFNGKSTSSDQSGQFVIPYLREQGSYTISATNHQTLMSTSGHISELTAPVLTKNSLTWWERLRLWWKRKEELHIDVRILQ